MVTLEMIDQVKARADVSYKEAKDALEAVGGDPVEAIILLESKKHKGIANNVTEMGNEIMETLKDLVKKGNLTRITLEKEGNPPWISPSSPGLWAQSSSPLPRWRRFWPLWWPVTS